MTSRSPLLALALAFAVLPLGSACIFKSLTSQASSESSSDSSASSSDSSSKSSGSVSGSSSPSSREAGYERDVRDYTSEFVLSGANVDSFRARIGQIAKDHGISDWEQHQATYEGIGRGIKKAKVSGERLKQLEAELAGPNPQSMKWIQSGYDSE